MIVFSKKLKITECCPKHFLTMHSVVSQTEIKMININETNKKHCCGCTACESVCHKKCISMQTDNEDLNIRLSIKLNVLTVAFVKRFVLYSIKHIMYFQIPHILFVIKILKLSAPVHQAVQLPLSAKR